jgi:uncharacterized RDD family membrane protein YckC
MPWYYANNNHRLGPVSDAEFARLAKDKIIVDDTLVWRHGMPDWKTYAEVVATLPPPEITAIPVGMESKVPQNPDSIVQEVLAATPPRLAYAGFWIRVCAKCIDLLILNMLVMMVAKIFGVWHEPPMIENMDQLMQFVREMNSLGRIAIVVSFFYQWFFLRRFSATPGKLLLGLRVVRSDGSPLSHGRIFGRFFAEMLNQFTLFIGYLVAAFDDEKRAMHDMICDTRVIHRRRE